ncbi:DB module, partial [Oesophagostomum dentatum]
RATYGVGESDERQDKNRTGKHGQRVSDDGALILRRSPIADRLKRGMWQFRVLIKWRSLHHVPSMIQDGVIVGDDHGEQAHTTPLKGTANMAANATVEQLLNPNFIFHSCCEARGLPDACLHYCHFNTYTADTLERMFHKQDKCPIEAAHEIHYCAAQGIDHTEVILF